MNWLIFSLLTLILWGVWGIFAKLSLNLIDWKVFWIISMIPYILTTLLFYLLQKPELSVLNKGIQHALIAGTIGTLAYVFYFKALEVGKASLVITLTALYPLVSIILAFLILKESINLFQAIGLALALISIVLLSIS